MKRIFACLITMTMLGLWSMTASASSDRAWSSMLVSGIIDINPDGSVRDYRMDQAQKIPGIVLSVLKQTVPSWHFKLSTANNVIAQAKMSIRVVAQPVDGGKMAFSVEGVNFGAADAQAAEQLKYRSHPAPGYPSAAVQDFASATAYMVVRIGRDGHVLDVAGEQVNFTAPVVPSKRGYLEKVFVNASAAAIRHWTFDVPTRGPEAGSAYLVARIPMTFEFRMWNSPNKPEAYGSWQPYLPGPRLATPDWMQNQTGLASAPDAIPDDGITQLKNGLHLAESDHRR